MNQQESMYVMSKHLQIIIMSMNFHRKRFHISRDTSEIVSHVIKQCLQAFYHHRNRFLKKLMVSAGVSWNGKTEIFFIDPQKTKVNQKTYIDFLKTSLLPEWRRLNLDNDFVFMHCFMTCNTISLVSRLIWKRFRWKFVDIFEDVCSLHTCFSADSFHLLCCVTPCESSGRFFGTHGIYSLVSWLITFLYFRLFVT